MGKDDESGIITREKAGHRELTHEEVDAWIDNLLKEIEQVAPGFNWRDDPPHVPLTPNGNNSLWDDANRMKMVNDPELGSDPRLAKVVMYDVGYFAETFFRKLLSYVQEMADRDEWEQGYIIDFVGYVRDQFFNTSESPQEYLTLEQNLSLYLQFQQNIYLKKVFSHDLFSSLVYRINFFERDQLQPFLRQVFEQSSIGDKIALMRLLDTLLERADSYAEDLRDEVSEFVQAYLAEVAEGSKLIFYGFQSSFLEIDQQYFDVIAEKDAAEQTKVRSLVDPKFVNGAIVSGEPFLFARDLLGAPVYGYDGPEIGFVAPIDQAARKRIDDLDNVIPRDFVRGFRNNFSEFVSELTKPVSSSQVNMVIALTNQDPHGIASLWMEGSFESFLLQCSGLEEVEIRKGVRACAILDSADSSPQQKKLAMSPVMEFVHLLRIDPDWSDELLRRMEQYQKTHAPIQPKWMRYAARDGGDALVIGDKGAQQETLVLLQELHNPRIRFHLEAELGFLLTELSFDEQKKLLSYIAGAATDKADNAFDVIRKFGVNAARAFLSCEYGTHYGDAILDIGSKLSTDDARAIFDRYADVVDAIEGEVERVLAGKDGISPALRERIVNEVLSRAKDVIALGGRGARGEIDAELIMKALESYRQDTVAFISIFKHASDKDLDIESLGKISFETLHGGSISPEDQRAMIELAQGNWAIDKPEAWPLVRDAITKGLESPSTTWHVFRLGGKIEAFVRFEDRAGDPGVRYGGNFNTSRGMRGAMLGEHFLARAVEVEAVDYVIEAVFFPSVRAGSMYIEKMGFVGVGVDATPLTDREKSPQIQIRRDDALIKTLETRSWHRTDIVRASIDHQSGDIVVAKFTMPDEEELFAHRVGEMTRSGYVLSRYVYPNGGEKGGLAYTVFEKPAQPAGE